MNRADRASTAHPFIAGMETAELTAIVTGRTNSLFASDLAASSERILAKVRDRRILVIGGGGSIGAATVRIILDYQPSALHIVDHNENYLAELVRELRGRSAGIPDIDFRALPLDYGGPVMERFLADSPPYDVVLNFAALKHVRSEKDIYSVLQMFDTNVVRHLRFKRWLAEHRPRRDLLRGIDRQGGQPRQPDGSKQAPDGGPDLRRRCRTLSVDDLGAICQCCLLQRQPAARLWLSAGQTAAARGAARHAALFHFPSGGGRALPLGDLPDSG